MSDQPQDDTENDGIIDESERTFLPSEKLLALYLVKHGARHIKAIPEHGEGRHPDALIDGRYVEFKTVQAGATSTTIKLSVNDSLRGKGQAREIIVDTRGAGVNQEEAEHALRRVAGITRSKLDKLRIIGDGFDLSRSY